MNEKQKECFQMYCDIVGGEHHFFGKVRESGHNGIMINTYNYGFSTYDFNLLTKAVIFAHDRKIRFEIQPCTPRMIKVFLHKREIRKGGCMWEMHPHIEEQILNIRKNYPYKED